DGPAHDPALEVFVFAERIEQGREVLAGIRGNVRDPDAIALRSKADRQVRLGAVPRYLAVAEMLPTDAVVTVHRPGTLGDGGGGRAVVVFAGQIDEVDGQRRPGQVVEAEVIPVGLPVAMVLVGLPGDGAAKVGGRHRFHLSDVSALEVGRDGYAGEKKESEH